MTEYRDMLITKIDESKDKLNSLVSEINSDLKACVLQFTETINNKIKTLETNFSKQTDELEKLKKDLSDKKFDENNYMNVSITMNLAKQIKERDLRIKELEQRIKYNDESKSSINNESKVETTQENQVTEPIIVPEKKSTKISIKSKTAINDKSTSEPISEPIVELIVEPIVEEKPKKKITIKKQTKAEIAKEEARLAEAETSRLAEEASRIAKESSILAEEAVRLAEEEAQRKEAVRLAEEEKAIRLAEEEAQRKEAVRLAEEEKAIRLAEEEKAMRLAEEEKAVRLAEEEAQRKEEPKVVAKKKATEKATEKVTEKASEKSKTKEKSKEKSKEKTNDIPEKVEYPSDIPNIEDVEVLEYKNNDYYMDKLNNVFQMTNEQDIGIFIGVYNKTTKDLMYIQN